jgi:hypothetical protein
VNTERVTRGALLDFGGAHHDLRKLAQCAPHGVDPLRAVAVVVAEQDQWTNHGLDASTSAPMDA